MSHGETMTNTPPPFTLRSAAGLPADPPALSDTTLLVIDAQVDYEPGGLLELPDHGAAIDNIAILLRAARMHHAPVLHIAHQGSAGSLFDPATGGRISTAVQPVGDEAVISKTLPNAFAGTNLHDQLQAIDTEHIVLVGFMTHMCVSSTARAALDLGYATTVVSDATATRDLPSPTGGPAVSASAVHNAELAALADRFSIIVTTAELLAAQRPDIKK